jgi:hypothetical protein
MPQGSMSQGIWTIAKLTSEQEKELKEAEKTLGNGVILAFAESQVAASELTPSQLECLQGLEKKLGLVLVSVKSTSK